MPEYLAPGVYVEEVSFRPRSIEGVSTSTTAFVGPTRKGPLDGPPEVITSYGEFERVYGGMTNLSYAAGTDADPDVTNYLAHGVRAFFDNGGRRLYVARTFVPRTGAGGAVTSTGVAAAIVADDGAGNRARFVARVPGSGLNGTVRVYEKRARATAVTLNAAPEGSLASVGGTRPARPAQLQGGTPPFSLNDGDELQLILPGGTQSVTFQGTAAEVAGTALADPVDLPAGTTLNVTVDGAAQAIPLPEGSTSLAALLSAVNAGLRGGYARLEGGDRLAVGTDRRGTAAQVTVSRIDVLGFAADATASGTGNVADLDAVSVAEIDALLTAAGIPVRASLPPSTGRLTLSTTATGSGATLQIGDNAARVALSLPATEAQGQDGETLLYYEKRGQSWVGGADGTSTLDVTAVAGAEIVTANLEAEDADGTVVFYEELGFGGTHPRWLGRVLAERPTRRAEALRNPYYLEVTGTVDAFALRQGLFGTDAENSFVLAGGNDGAEPTVSSTVEGAVAFDDALELLEEVEDISIVAAPGHSALQTTTFRGVQQALISHAERMKYRIAVLDTPGDQTLSDARDVRSRVDSTYAALYYPWVVVANPLARPGNERIPREIALPPSGFVTGIYARSDVERGVWKPPANEVVRGALRFEREITHGQQEVLNPEGINCLRYFFGRGFRVWGARTVSSDPEWKYVNVRRYFIYLERSVDRSTQWAVFEPNNERLWSNVRDTVSAFLYNEWRSGALLGATPEEAYFVRCDRSTMTQADLDNGRLVCEIGVAAVKPAEFVIFRIGQKTADARS
ncbi:MAG: phage tail sheath family protein [Deferrisomatales bacterium]